jgi:hypothetical protein
MRIESQERTKSIESVQSVQSARRIVSVWSVTIMASRQSVQSAQSAESVVVATIVADEAHALSEEATIITTRRSSDESPFEYSLSPCCGARYGGVCNASA